MERQYRDVVDERETLSAEVIRLKEEILRKEEERNSLNSYDPNGPQALQRKIGMLFILISTPGILHSHQVLHIWDHGLNYLTVAFNCYDPVAF